MAENRINLTISAHEHKLTKRISALIGQVSFDSSRRNAFTPRLPELRNIHIFRRNEIEYRAVPNIHGYYVLWICLSGTGQLLVDGAHQELSTSETTLVLPGQPHIRLPDPCKRRVSWLLIRFESDDKGWFADFRNSRSKLDEAMTETLAQMLENYTRKGDIPGESICGALLQLLLLQLLEATRKAGTKSSSTSDLPPAGSGCIRELCELMMQMPPVKDPFKVVAARRNVTPAYLHVLFRKKTGHTPRDFMSRQKLNLAQHLLGNSELTVSEIALRCGFSGIYSFSKFFRKKCNMTPGEYRKTKGEQLTADGRTPRK